MVTYKEKKTPLVGNEKWDFWDVNAQDCLLVAQFNSVHRRFCGQNSNCYLSCVFVHLLNWLWEVNPFSSKMNKIQTESNLDTVVNLGLLVVFTDFPMVRNPFRPLSLTEVLSCKNFVYTLLQIILVQPWK